MLAATCSPTHSPTHHAAAPEEVPGGDGGQHPERQGLGELTHKVTALSGLAREEMGGRKGREEVSW